MAIHERQYYRTLSEDQIRSALTSEGHAPTRVADGPGTVYSSHRNSCDLILAFLQGSADIQIGDKQYPCIAGDRLNIPGARPHSGVVGEHGVVYLMTQMEHCCD